MQNSADYLTESMGDFLDIILESNNNHKIENWLINILYARGSTLYKNELHSKEKDIKRIWYDHDKQRKSRLPQNLPTLLEYKIHLTSKFT